MNKRLIEIIKLCEMEKSDLKQHLINFLYNKHYKKVCFKNDYIFAEGDIPICLVAHIDTIFQAVPIGKDIIHDPFKKIIWFPGGSGFDDRAGIYAIKSIINQGYNPHIIFTDEEENGGVGSRKLISDYKKIPFDNCKALIQLDRKGKNDAVFYDCDNINFEQYITNFGFKTEYGTFSDISILAPAWNIPAVNLSIGYLDEHTALERLHYQWCFNTIEKVEDILDKANEMPNFEYIPYIRPKFDFLNKKTCLLCGTDKNLKYIKEKNNLSFYLCDKCFKETY